MPRYPLNPIKFFLINILIFLGQTCYGQGNEVTIQTWYSFTLNKNFSNNFMFYANPEYNEMLKGDDAWGEVALTTGIEYYPNNSIDLYFDIYNSYTVQVSGVNTMEVRPRLGARWHIVKPERKIPIFIQGLYEFRNQYDIDASKWTHSHRFRVRPEFKVSINRSNILEDKNFLLRTYAEFFMNTDKKIEERFWNRRSLGLGIYYRHNGRRRYELRYISQDGKNSLEQERFKVTSNILYLLVTFFL